MTKRVFKHIIHSYFIPICHINTHNLSRYTTYAQILSNEDRYNLIITKLESLETHLKETYTAEVQEEIRSLIFHYNSGKYFNIEYLLAVQQLPDDLLALYNPLCGLMDPKTFDETL